jgi:hypothetical protein
MNLHTPVKVETLADVRSAHERAAKLLLQPNPTAADSRLASELMVAACDVLEREVLRLLDGRLRRRPAAARRARRRKVR